MKCVKCGTDLEENAKFCGNCGNPVELNETETLEETQTVEPVQEVNFSSEVSNEPHVERQEIVQQPLPFDTPEFKEKQEKSKKSTKAVKTIVIIAGVLLVIAALVFAYFKVFKKESYEKSIDSMEKAINNFAKKGSNSGTVVASVKMKSEGDFKMDLDLTAFVKYEKENDNFKLNLGLEKSSLLPALDAYAEVDDKNATIYIPGELISYISAMFGEDTSLLGTNSASLTGTWFKYTTDVEELGIDLDDFETEENQEMDLTKVFPKDSFKYVDRKNGLKHYVLTIDDKFIANTGADLGSEFESFKGMKFNIDFYLTDSNELRKVQVDLKDMLKEKLQDSGITKLLVVVEFKDFGSTKVDIPTAAKINSIDVSGYIDDDFTSQQTSGEYTAEDIYYDIMLSASMESCDTELVVDFKNYNDELFLYDDEYDIKRITDGKIRIYKKDGETDCAVETITPIVIDGKTCEKDPNYSYDGICK